MKQCTKCGEWKDEVEYHKDKNMKDGLHVWCKECAKEYKKYYHKNNKEKIKEYNKKYRENNKDEIRKCKKEYRENNKKIIKEAKKDWYNSPLTYNSTIKIRKEIELYEEIKESPYGNLMCKCAYCGEWFEPSKLQMDNRLKAIYDYTGNGGSEGRLYCSYQCKINCPIYRQRLYSKDHKPATSREVQPELRQLVFERDKYTCQKCNTHRDNLEVGIHCHHKEGILWEPLQSADIDMCITLCEDCHKEVHGIDGCGYQDMKCIG